MQTQVEPRYVADLFPARVDHLPPGVEGPPPGSRVRAVIADLGVVLAWERGDGSIASSFWAADTSRMDHLGGMTADGTTVVRASGCGCGHNALRSWDPKTAVWAVGAGVGAA